MLLYECFFWASPANGCRQFEIVKPSIKFSVHIHKWNETKLHTHQYYRGNKSYCYWNGKYSNWCHPSLDIVRKYKNIWICNKHFVTLLELFPDEELLTIFIIQNIYCKSMAVKNYRIESYAGLKPFISDLKNWPYLTMISLVFLNMQKFRVEWLTLHVKTTIHPWGWHFKGSFTKSKAIADAIMIIDSYYARCTDFTNNNLS